MKTVLDVLEKQLDDNIDNCVNHLSHNRCEDYPEYRELNGLLRGLRAAKNLTKELKQKWENEDDGI
jgi:hypothetical protein